MIALYDYQEDIVQRVSEAWRSGHKNVLVQSETGSGKSVIAAEMIRRALDRGKRSLFLAHARLLVSQFSSKALTDMGVSHGVWMAGEPLPEDGCKVHVASRDTLESWTKRRRLVLPEKDLLIVDEAHRLRGGLYQKLLCKYADSYKIFLTATPALSDKGGLGRRPGDPTDMQLPTVLVCGPPTSQLISQGKVLPAKCYAPPPPDLSGCSGSSDGWDMSKAEKRLNKPKLVGSVIETWRQHASGQRTIGFATKREHARELVKQFNRAGIPSEYMDAHTDKAERFAILKRLDEGVTLVVWNVDVLTEGIDVPSISCVIWAKPCNSIVKVRQGNGRAKRPYPGKTHATILDHAGICYTTGHPDVDLAWSLDCDQPIKTRSDTPSGRIGDGSFACGRCFAVVNSRPPCPECGWLPPAISRAHEWVAGRLVPVEVEQKKPTIELNEYTAKNYWFMCLRTAHKRAAQASMALGMFRRKFEKMPWECGFDLPHLDPVGGWKEPFALAFPELAETWGRKKG